jgi:hypothetical protein
VIERAKSCILKVHLGDGLSQVRRLDDDTHLVILTGRSSAMAPSSRRRRRPPRSAVGAYCRRYICRRCIIRSPECHSVNALVFEVLAQRQHVRVARPTLEAFNQEQSLAAVHHCCLLNTGKSMIAGSVLAPYFSSQASLSSTGGSCAT